MRHQLLRILRQIEPRREGEREHPTPWISRLAREGKIERPISRLMLTIVEFRNVAEWSEYRPTPEEAVAVRAAWAAILKWAEGKGMNLDAASHRR